MSRLWVCGNLQRIWRPVMVPECAPQLPVGPGVARAAVHNTVISVDERGVWRDAALAHPFAWGRGARVSDGGTSHFFVYDGRGRALGFGNNSHGQAEVKREGAEVLACGWETSAAVEAGALYVWGRTSDLALEGSLESDGRVAALRGVAVANVALGFGHAAVLAADGTLFAWGETNAARHGQGGKLRVVAEGVKQVVSGATHSVALARQGKVLVWGSAGDGKLGAGKERGEDAREAIEVKLPERATWVAVGCDHSVAVGESGAAYAWGFGQHGAAGTGRLETEYVPRKVKLDAIVQRVWCGTDFSVFETD